MTQTSQRLSPSSFPLSRTAQTFHLHEGRRLILFTEPSLLDRGASIRNSWLPARPGDGVPEPVENCRTGRSLVEADSHDVRPELSEPSFLRAGQIPVRAADSNTAIGVFKGWLDALVTANISSGA